MPTLAPIRRKDLIRYFRHCHILQLTTNSERTDAHRFYENLGFHGTHLGMKLNLK